MIYDYKYFTDALAELHPEIERSSLELITKRGLQGLNRIMRSGQELLVHQYHNNGKTDDWIKFFINMTPEAQKRHALKQYFRKHNNKDTDGGEQSSTE